MTVKFYAERDIMEMDNVGGYYIRHVSAMTSEELHSKSGIAAELGWRDMKIAELQRKVEALAGENAQLRTAIEFATAPDMWVEQHNGMLDYRYSEWYVDVLNTALETPVTEAAIAEIEARGVDKFAKYLGEDNSVFVEAKSYYRGLSEAACEFSDHLRKESGQ